MKKIAIIGAGISGVSLGRMLQGKAEVTILEKSAMAGGLVKCDRIAGSLFHRVGGHVFNSRNQEVLNWFWSFFDRDKEFIKARRNAKILLNGQVFGYPLENYLYQFPKETVDAVFSDLLKASGTVKKPEDYPNFEAFLKGNFGETLFKLYFEPYNRKIWNTDLSQVPLGWLEGKLPMPNLKEIILSNIIKEEEGSMVHSTFFYAKNDGSQFIVNRLAEGLDIRLNQAVQKIEKQGSGWNVNGDGPFDAVVFCGDVRKLGNMLTQVNDAIQQAAAEVNNLKSNGTSNLLCECDPTPVSWMYLPGPEIQAHRIIYTGNFSETNNGEAANQGRITCTVEFSGHHEPAFMQEQIKQLPGNMRYLDHNHEPNSYVIQDTDTRDQINNLKSVSEPQGLYLLGRFAEWEYYNMDKAMEAGFMLVEKWEKSGWLSAS